MAKLNKRQRREKKRKEKRRKLRAQGGPADGYLHLGLATPKLPALAVWPVKDAYFSDPLVFRICGQGLLCFSRQKETGEILSVIAILDYFRGGFKYLNVVENESVSSFEKQFLLGAAKEDGYILRPIPTPAAAVLLWGTWGFQHQL